MTFEEFLVLIVSNPFINVLSVSLVPLAGITEENNTVQPQAAQAHYVWVRDSEVIWSEYTRIIRVLSDAK